MYSFIITDDICQYWKNLDEMILSSPYNADVVRCEWIISAQEGFIIALEFIHFHVSMLKLDLLKKYVVRFHTTYFCMLVI